MNIILHILQINTGLKYLNIDEKKLFKSYQQNYVFKAYLKYLPMSVIEHNSKCLENENRLINI